jgi:DNA-binding NtrC family response regulator
VEIVLLTAHGSIENAVRAIKDGAFNFLEKPANMDHLLHVVDLAREHQRVRRRTRAFEAASELPPDRPIIAESGAMKQVRAMADQVARTDATVLIQGETGTGKELIAHAIHARSRRAAQSLIAVNCAAIPEGLVESELFGYEKGAFTGGGERKPGRFELADGGTLFLDEVSELAPAIQAKLLRVLQEREIERLGGTRPIAVDARIVAATNRDLLKLMGERAFREDLYYRLNVVTIDLPPLRERREDIGPLAEHFLRVYARQLEKEVTRISAEARALMAAYRWPGNVRELEHAIYRAVIRVQGDEVEMADLGIRPETLRVNGEVTEPTTLADLERKWILETVDRCRGNLTEAAGALGIDRSTLYRKLRQYGELH